MDRETGLVGKDGFSALRHGRRGSVGAALAALCLLAGTTGARADAPGNPLWGPWGANEGAEYPRVIRLQHAGAANGTLLATFEHTFRDGSPGFLVIRRSTDDGASWSTAATIPEPNKWPTMWQPSLLELPKRIGRYPEGTILLAENSSDKPRTSIMLFSSADHGGSWHQDSVVTSGDGPKRGVWEPLLVLDATGRLLMYFSDERRQERYSQFLGGYVYDERRNAFDTSHELDLASGQQSDRPGMVTIATVPGQGFIATYEVCTSLRVAHCPVHMKRSADGIHWPGGLGDAVEARDGKRPANNPYLVWSPTGGGNGQLSLISEYTSDLPSSLMLINRDSAFRPNAWEWVPRAYDPTNRTPYSASLLPSPDGRQMRLTGAARPYVLTATSNAGVLPYADTFALGADYGWVDFGGSWSVSREAGQGVYTDAGGPGGPGAKAIAGASLWRDYTLRSDVRLNRAGQAGVLVRVSNPGVGMDALNGYFIGINPTTGVLFGGREDGGWSGLASTPAKGLVVGHWYTIAVTAHGSQFDAVLTDRDGGAPLARITFSDARFASGAIGLRDFNASASWRSVRVEADTAHPPRIGRPMMPAGER